MVLASSVDDGRTVASASKPDAVAKSPMMAIEVQGVSKRFGSNRALDDVSLSVEPGTVLALLGPNGAGKTTLIRILTTLILPDTGIARVAGPDVRTEAKAIRSLIGLAGQYASVDELLTGRENLELVGLLYHLERSEYRRRAQDALERMTLTDAADRAVKTYSGGMRRRLDLAASLIGRPPFSCSTNQLPAWTLGRETTCGPSSKSSSMKARRCFSRRSTWRRPSIWPTKSCCSTLGAWWQVGRPIS